MCGQEVDQSYNVVFNAFFFRWSNHVYCTCHLEEQLQTDSVPHLIALAKLDGTVLFYLLFG